MRSFFVVGLLTLAFTIQSCSPKVIPTTQKETAETPIVTVSPVEDNQVTDSVVTDYTPDPYSSLVEMTTKFGSVKIELYCNTPLHKENFLTLVKDGFYEDLLFHRIIKDFMIQGGDPNSKKPIAGSPLGSGGPDYLIDAEFTEQYMHVKGALCAARTNNPEKASSGSQFYIVHGRPTTDDVLDANELKYNIVYTLKQRELYKTIGGTPQLDMEYTVFGRVYEGLDVIDKLAAVPTGRADRPEQDIKMSFKIIKE